MHSSSRLKWIHGVVSAAIAALPAAAAEPVKSKDGPGYLLQFAWESGESFGWDRIGAHLLVAFACSLILLWLSAKLALRTANGFAKAMMFVGVAMVVSSAFLALAAIVVYADSLVFAAVAGLAFLAILYIQARHTFEVSRGTALSLLGSYLVFMAGGFYLAEQLTGPMPWREFLVRSRVEKQKTFAEWTRIHASPAEASSKPAPGALASTEAIAAPAPTAAVPEATATVATPTAPTPQGPVRGAPDLQALFHQLQKARAELDPNDPVAVARFNEQAAAYNQEKALAAALSVPKAVPVRTEAADAAGKGNASQASSTTGIPKR